MLSITTAYEKSHDTPNEHFKRPQKVLGAPGVRLQAPPMTLSEASSKYRTPLRESYKRIDTSHGHIMAARSVVISFFNLSLSESNIEILQTYM